MTTPKTHPDKFAFSPTQNHRLLLRNSPLSLAYDGGDVGAWQRRLRKKFRQILGTPPAGKVPLAPRSLWTREHSLGTIEKIVFTAEAGSDVPAYVCLPRESRAPHRFVICLQGHTSGMHNSIAVSPDESHPHAVVGDQDFALGCMARGLAALCIEQRAIGEREERVQKSLAPKRCQDAAIQALMLGRTLVGERVFDLGRAVDYLEERGDVNMADLGVLGHSGGGTVALYGAALMPRLKWAMCSGYFCTYRDSVMAMNHCVCNYLPGLLQVAEMADIAGLIAPRPLVVVTGREDPMLPYAATKTAFRRLQTIYAAGGAADRCRLVTGPDGHRFYADAAWRAMRAFL